MEKQQFSFQLQYTVYTDLLSTVKIKFLQPLKPKICEFNWLTVEIF